jgi:hypothetical protein
MIFNLVGLQARQTGSSIKTKVLLRVMLLDTTVHQDVLVKQSLSLDNAASILVPKTSRLTSRPSCAPDHEVKSLLVYGIQLAPQGHAVLRYRPEPTPASGQLNRAVTALLKRHPG